MKQNDVVFAEIDGIIWIMDKIITEKSRKYSKISYEFNPETDYFYFTGGGEQCLIR